MSRSALFVYDQLQENSRRETEELLREAEQNVSPDALAIWGSEETFNFNHVLRTNILSSPYFKQTLYLETYEDLVGEITDQVDHLQPYIPGSRNPSTAFCLLYRLCTFRPTADQLKGMLDYQGAPYARAIGFLFLRYTCVPKTLWEWVQPYLGDEEEVVPRQGGKSVSIGKFIRTLLKDMRYFDTIFPRIPVPVQRSIDAKMSELDVDGSAVRLAVNAGDYQGGYAGSRDRSRNRKFRSRSRSPDAKRRRYGDGASGRPSRERSRSPSWGRGDVPATTSGRDFYSRSVGSVKASLSMPLEITTNRSRTGRPGAAPRSSGPRDDGGAVEDRYVPRGRRSRSRDHPYDRDSEYRARRRSEYTRMGDDGARPQRCPDKERSRYNGRSYAGDRERSRERSDRYRRRSRERSRDRGDRYRRNSRERSDRHDRRSRERSRERGDRHDRRSRECSRDRGSHRRERDRASDERSQRRRDGSSRDTEPHDKADHHDSAADEERRKQDALERLESLKEKYGDKGGKRSLSGLYGRR